MAQLILVRHAQASFGHDDYDKLSDLGHQQAALLGEYFTHRNQQFDLVVTGDMLRHQQTADGILGNNSQSRRIIDAGWNEFDFQSIVAAYLRLHPEKNPSPQAPRSQWYIVLKSAMCAWSANELALNNGETWVQFCERVHTSALTIQMNTCEKVMVVSSGGAMAVFLMALLNTSVEQAIAFNLQIKNTSVSHFYFNAKGFQLHSFNNVPHLDVADHITKITYS